jgi:acetyl-CoA carboxylase carboxyl transferase subunit alpha
VQVEEEIVRLEAKAVQTLKDLYATLTPWQKTQVARHPQRPHCLDFVNALIQDFVPFAGDRKFGEDEAIVGGFGRFRGESICIIGHEKGSTTEARLKHNFGMAKPEGYRKAVRLMEMADRFDIPVLALIDTAGAYPGIGAEERGQAEAIARSTEACLNLGVPNVAVILGEGGSGGAIAIATANRVLMLEHAIYSVISPEGAASILWHDTTKAQEAATNMKITALDLMRFGVIDEIIEEPVGGAHRDPAAAIAASGDAIAQSLAAFKGLDHDAVRLMRRQKFLAIGRTPPAA